MCDSCDQPECETTNENAARQTRCPRCGSTGRVVGDETLLALLEPGHANPMLAVERRFCRTPTCDVLYYGVDGCVVDKSAAAVRVGIKESEDPIPLCYCFNFTRADVQREIAKTGACSIPARITAEIRAGRCACEIKNPSGACCLGDLNRVVNESKMCVARTRDDAPRELNVALVAGGRKR